jgi:hypothetical protein
MNDDVMQLTKEIGWTEGHERAKRKSNPPPSAPAKSSAKSSEN